MYSIRRMHPCQAAEVQTREAADHPEQDKAAEEETQRRACDSRIEDKHEDFDRTRKDTQIHDNNSPFDDCMPSA